MHDAWPAHMEDFKITYLALLHDSRTCIAWKMLLLCSYIRTCLSASYDDVTGIEYKQNPAPDGHRCGICPTYFQKICAFNFDANTTFIFDNHCVMDLYNCIHGSEFIPLKYENCLFFGNFAYVHGIKREDMDYEEDHVAIINTKKNPDFV